MPTANALELLQQRVDAIEGGYEFMLAYAAQGLATDEGNANSEQLRTYLQRMDDGIAGLESALRAVARRLGLGRSTSSRSCRSSPRDAGAARAALRMVSSRQGVSSQLVDNLNASIHVRALLTDLFLLDEAVKSL